MFDLNRFIIAQETSYENALSELRAGHKIGHWIWYIFPQHESLGISPKSKYFGLQSLKEARDYMAHSILGQRYLECVNALLTHRDCTILEIMGTDLDAKKLLSSLTLMSTVCSDKLLQEATAAFYRDAYFEGELRSLQVK